MGRSWERTYNIELDAATKRNLLVAIEQERRYHNSLVNELNSKMRVLSRELSEIKDDREKLFGVIAQTSTKLSTIIGKPIDQWPEAFLPFKDVILRDGKPQLSDRSVVIYDIAAADADLHPQMRKAMATEILRCIQPQAKTILNSNNNASGQLSGPLQMLQPFEQGNKRHMQIPGTLLNMIYDDSKRETRIHLPYHTNEIVIRNTDLTKSPHDNAILGHIPPRDRSQPAKWHITIKEGNGRYLVDYVDSTYSPVGKRRHGR